MKLHFRYAINVAFQYKTVNPQIQLILTTFQAKRKICYNALEYNKNSFNYLDSPFQLLQVDTLLI